MQIRECMTPAPEACSPDDTIRDAARRMADGDFGAIPIVEDQRPIGILTDRDIAVRAVAQGRPADSTTVREIMTGECICVRDDADAEEAVRLMEQKQVRRLMVTDADGRLCGMLSTADVARELGDTTTAGEVLEEVSKPAA